MLDMGFEAEVRRIIEGSEMPEANSRQTLMFSVSKLPALHTHATGWKCNLSKNVRVYNNIMVNSRRRFAQTSFDM